MDLDELRALLAVADTGSLVSAAERLGLPRTTLRRRIEALEARVGAPLVYTGSGGAALSATGETVAGAARRVLHEASALLAAGRGQGDAAEGVLHVVLPVGLPPHALAPIYARCREAWPRLHFDVQVVEDPLAHLGADLVFHFGPRVQSGPWVTRTLLTLPERLLAAPGYLQARGAPTRFEDLTGHDFLVWRRPGAESDRLPLLVGGDRPLAPTLVAPDVHTLRQLALAGAGIALLPDGPIPDPGDAPALVPVLSDLVGRDCPFNVVVPEALARSAQVRALQREILGFLSE